MKCSEVMMKWNIVLDIYFIYLFIIGMAIRGASVIGVLYWWVFVPQERAPTTCLFYFYFFKYETQCII